MDSQRSATHAVFSWITKLVGILIRMAPELYRKKGLPHTYIHDDSDGSAKCGKSTPEVSDVAEGACMSIADISSVLIKTKCMGNRKRYDLLTPDNIMMQAARGLRD